MDTYAPCSKCGKLNRVPLSPVPGGARRPVCGACRAELPVHDGVVSVSDTGLSRLIAKSPLPVVADFWAPWCGPCKIFAPTFAQAAGARAGKAVFAKIDTQAYPQAAEAFSIRGIPTLAVFRDGTERSRESGAMPLESFLRWLSSVLG